MSYESMSMLDRLKFWIEFPFAYFRYLKANREAVEYLKLRAKFEDEL